MRAFSVARVAVDSYFFLHGASPQLQLLYVLVLLNPNHDPSLRPQVPSMLGIAGHGDVDTCFFIRSHARKSHREAGAETLPREPNAREHLDTHTGFGRASTDKKKSVRTRDSCVISTAHHPPFSNSANLAPWCTHLPGLDSSSSVLVYDTTCRTATL